MAITTQKQSKRLFMSLLLLIFLSWIILLGWALSLWALSDFETSWQAVYKLSVQQSAAVSEFSEASVAEQLTSWLNTVPTQQITDNVTRVQTSIQNELNTMLPDENPELNDMAEDVLRLGKQLWMIAKLTAHLMFIKLMILLAALPLFALATTAGLVDGLNQRAIRTASLGRESSYVFHQFNRYFKRGLLLLLALWIAIPISITPALVFVPVSVLISLMVSITASRFKKYL